jgi:hypothetical protein
MRNLLKHFRRVKRVPVKIPVKGASETIPVYARIKAGKSGKVFLTARLPDSSASLNGRTILADVPDLKELIDGRREFVKFRVLPMLESNDSAV